MPDRQLEPVPCCWDCGVGIGEAHLDLCDVARCLATGYGQRLSCMDAHMHDCGRDVHTGFWPGVLDCREFGWYTPGPPPGFDGPFEDLNRLALAAARGEIRWDRAVRRFRLPDQDDS